MLKVNIYDVKIQNLYMKFIKKFEKFLEASAAEPQVDPGKTKVKPDVKPGKPLTRPQKPDPFRRDKPSVEPDPKAGSKKASAEEVAERFIDLMVKGNEDVKKYAKTV